MRTSCRPRRRTGHLCVTPASVSEGAAREHHAAPHASPLPGPSALPPASCFVSRITSS